MTSTSPDNFIHFKMSEDQLAQLRYVEENVPMPKIALPEWLWYCRTTHSLQLVQIAQLYPFRNGHPMGIVPKLAFDELIARGFYN